jgi:hypothetical protein
MKDIFHVEVSENERQLILDVLVSISTVTNKFSGCNTLDFRQLRDTNYWHNKLTKAKSYNEGLIGLVNKSMKMFSTLDSLPKLVINKDQYKLGPTSITTPPLNCLIKYKNEFYFQRAMAGDRILLKLINFPFIRN